MDRPKPHSRCFSELPSGNLAGIDEAGRGCLAGPVVAAAVMLSPDHSISGLADSKLLSPAKRERLAEQIRLYSQSWSIGIVWQRRIDEINILQATFEAMAKAAGSLKIKPDHLFVDGNKTIPDSILANFHVNPAISQKCVIDGDYLVPQISAASIIAKTFRDRLMIALSKKYPGYGFDKHKGYGTKAHYAALARLGACPLHRLTFRGVKSDDVQITFSEYPYWQHFPGRHE